MISWEDLALMIFAVAVALAIFVVVMAGVFHAR